VLFGARPGRFADGETTLAHDVLMTALRPGMLCLADRQFFGHALWRTATATGADLLWRVKHNVRLPREARLADGSHLTTIYPREKDRRHERPTVSRCGWSSTGWRASPGGPSRSIGWWPPTLLDPAEAPAAGLAALCHERWESEGAPGELKTHRRGAQAVLRGKTPELVRQEFWGLLLPAHFAVRGLMHGAAPRAEEDPDRPSFLHAVPCTRCPARGALHAVRVRVRVRVRVGPAQAAAARGPSPLGPGSPRMRRCAGRDPGGAGGERPRSAGGARGQAQDARLQAAPAHLAADHPHRLRRRHSDRKVNSIGANTSLGKF
jgi:hypothetical protein